MRVVAIAACSAALLMTSVPADAHWRASGWKTWAGYSQRGCRSSGLCLPRAHTPRDPFDLVDSNPWRERASSQDFSDFEPRDMNGRSRRSGAARRAFEYSAPCPSTGLPHGACPGYVVDHIIALKRGGADDPSNMQWQTVEDAKAKDRVE